MGTCSFELTAFLFRKEDEQPYQSLVGKDYSVSSKVSEMMKRSNTFAGTSGVVRSRVRAAEPLVRYGEQVLRFEVCEERRLLSIGVYSMETEFSPVLHVEIQQSAGQHSNDVVNLKELPNGQVRFTGNGEVLQSLGRLYAVGVVTYGGNDVVDATGLTTTAAVIWLGEGDDRAYGGKADDWVIGGPGNDWIELGEGSDHGWGEGGVDVISGNRIVIANGVASGFADGEVDFISGGCGDADHLGVESLGMELADWVEPENVPGLYDHLYVEVFVPQPPQPPEQTALPSGWTFEIDTLTIDLWQTNGSVNELGPSAVDVVWAGGHREIQGFRILKIYGTDQAEQFRFERLTDVAIEIFGNGGDDEAWGNMVFHGGAGADTFHGHGTFFAQDGVAGNDYWPTFSGTDCWGDRDASSPQSVQTIVSWNDGTGVTTIEARRVHFEEVSYPGVDGNFYRLHLNAGLADDQWYPLVFRQNNLISVGALSLDNITYSPGLKTKFQANDGLVEYVVQPLPGVVDPLRG